MSVALRSPGGLQFSSSNLSLPRADIQGQLSEERRKEVIPIIDTL
jgi:hypothetical protein